MPSASGPVYCSLLRGSALETQGMFEHLLSPEFQTIEDASVPELLSAQAATADWLQELGGAVDVIPEEEARALAQNAFTHVTGADVDPGAAKAAILAMRAPTAVQHHAQMLSAYDWAFVEQAKEIRGYIVAKLLDETKHHDAKVRLQALKLLGSIVEVGAYSQRVEVTNHTSNTDEVVARLREKLQALLPKADVTDAKVIESKG